MLQIALSNNNLETIDAIHNEAIFKFIKAFNVSINTYESIKEKYISQEEKVKDMDYYYQVLKCSRTATVEDIKKQYRILCKKYHPDTYLSKDLPEEIINLTAEKFKEVNEAYEKIMEKLKSTAG